MKRVKILLMLAFAGLSAVAWGQDGTIDKGSGWLYFSGVPGTTPNVSCCAEIAMNILTREAYVWNRDSSEWELFIELTQGLAAPSGDPGDGPKLFLNRDDGLLYRWDGDSWEAYGTSGVSDGDKGDITVSSSGAVWNIDAGVVGASEIASTAVTPASYTFTSLTVDADGRITSASNGTEVDGSITNEGSLTVGAGTGSTSLINSNTSGSTAVTLEAGSNITISEAGNTITIAAAASATDSSIYKLLPLRSVTIDPNNFDLQIGTDALNNTGEFEFYALNAQGNDVGIYAGSEDSSGISGLFPAAAALFSDDGNVLIDYNYVGDIYNVAMFGDSMFMGAYPGADLGLHIDDLPRDPQDTLSLLLVQDWVTRRVYRRDASTLGGGQTLFKVENSATDATVGTTNNYHTGKLGIGNFSSDVLGASLHIYNTDATITLSDSTSTDSTATPQIKFFRGHNASLLGRMGYLSTTNTDLYFANNATAGKLTFQTEGATVAQLLPSGQLLLPEYGDSTFTGTAVKYLAVTDAGNVIEADGGGSSAPSVSSPTVSGTTSVNFTNLDRGIFDLDMTGVVATTLSLSNPRNGGEYVFWFDAADNEEVTFPNNFLTAGRDTLGTRELAASRLMRFFYDGTNYICEDTLGAQSGTTYLDTVLLSGIVAWYEANDIGQADGTPVTTWNDISGNGNHLVQDTSARQPNYETNFVSGEAVVDFDGVDEWMRTLTGSLVLDTINRTFFIVCKSDDAGTSSGIFMFNDGSEETAGTAGQFGLTNEIALRIDGGNRAWTSDLVTGDGWDMLVVQLGTSSTNGTSTSDISLWINGSAATVSSTSVLTLDTDDTFFSVGRKTADFSQVFSFFDGQIAEIIAYSRALTTAERQNIETYLTNKYGAF